MNLPLNISELVQQFNVEGEFVCAEVIPSGHINDTYAVALWTEERQVRRLLLQRINHRVFKHPDLLMQNIAAVSKHIRVKISEAGGDPLRESMNIIPTVTGQDFILTPQGDWWRAFILIDGARTYDMPQSLDQVYSAGKAFGNFRRQLGDFPADSLHETIPDFHDTRKRFSRFTETLSRDQYQRSKLCQEEIDLALQYSELAPVLVDMLDSGELPGRVTHNDTKFNNILIDDKTDQGVCVIDLDTVMPGSSLFDFGDGIRTITNAAPEDERDLTKVFFCLARYEYYCKGFLDGTRGTMTPSELKYLAFSARLMTYELGLRFLTDYLDGDRYFKSKRPAHNLDRCRVQFRLLQDMEVKSDRMEGIVQQYVSSRAGSK